MKNTLIFISQSYLNHATVDALEVVANYARMVLILPQGEDIDPKIAPFIDELYIVEASLTENIRPVFNLTSLITVITPEIARVGTPGKVRIFCQQEDNILVAAQVRQQLNIKGDMPEIIELFKDKIKMKAAVSNIYPQNIPKHETLDIDRMCADPAAYYDYLIENLGEKMIVKPTSAAGSFNVEIVNDITDFLRVGAMIGQDEYKFDYEIDEFISGTMYQCDSLVIDGQTTFCSILELGCTNFDFVQGKPLSVFPAIDKALYQRLYNFNQEVISELGLIDGSAHHELFIKDQTQEIVFLEIAARVPGGIGVHFHETNSNINLIDANLYLTVNKELLAKIQPVPKNNVVSALLPVTKGIIKKLNEPDILSPYAITWYVKEGGEVDCRSLIDTAGVLTFSNDDMQVLRSDFEKLQAYIPVTTEW